MEHPDDEMREISPLLRDLKVGNGGMQTPTGYFDDLDARVFERLDAMGARRSTPTLEATSGRHLTHRWLQPRILMAIAAGLALAIAAFWFFRAPAVADQSAALAAVTMPDLSEEDIETYVLENVHEFDTEQLAALPPAETADQMPEFSAPKPAQNRSKKQQALDELRPEDLENLLNELSDEDLEKLL